MNREAEGTRSRVLQAATTLFSERGFQGAGVREICNMAGANPGAVSYHFGGKRQLYRATLREAIARLTRGLVQRHPEAPSPHRPTANQAPERTQDDSASLDSPGQPDRSSAAPVNEIRNRALSILRRLDEELENDPTTARLLARDLADGGAMAVEALSPVMRSAEASLRTGLGLGDDPSGQAAARYVLARLAAPLLLLHAGGPLLRLGLAITAEQRHTLLDEMLDLTGNFLDQRAGAHRHEGTTS